MKVFGGASDTAHEDARVPRGGSVPLLGVNILAVGAESQ